MELAEVRELNHYLSGVKTVDSSDPGPEIFIDNLHTPFLELKEEYTLPSISTTHGIDFTAASHFLRSVSDFIPNLLSGMNVLPEPRPKKNTEILYLVKEIEFGSGKFLFLIGLHLGYLGGAPKGKIVSPASQGKTSCIVTNRIYYSICIIPLESVKKENGIVVDFSAKNYNPADFMAYMLDENSKIAVQSAVFDEVDYSGVREKLYLALRIGPDVWSLGKVFDPITIEYQTLSFRFLETDQKECLDLFESYHHLVAEMFRSDILTLDQTGVQYLHKWLKRYKPERMISPSGNMLWKIHKFNS